MRHVLLLIILAFTIQTSLVQLSGYVFIDDNGNGIKEQSEKTLAGAIISDGLNVLKSNSDGYFELEGWEKQRFVT